MFQEILMLTASFAGWLQRERLRPKGAELQ